MSVRRATSQLLPARSVHLRIVPRPANLSESREIFRVLQGYGEMSVFKYLRYEYHNPADNIALAIYRDATAAQKALDASPIQFTLQKLVNSAETSQKHGEDEEGDGEYEHPTGPVMPTKDGIDEILRPSTLSVRTQRADAPQPPASAPPPMPFDPAHPTSTATHVTKSKWFQITVDRSRAVHQDFVERQPYWKQFSPMKSMAQEDLAKQVPHIGLSDVSKRPPNAHRTPNKVLKGMSEYVDKSMPTLRGMAENSANERSYMERRELRGRSDM
jgi:hypothetical protein